MTQYIRTIKSPETSRILHTVRRIAQVTGLHGYKTAAWGSQIRAFVSENTENTTELHNLLMNSILALQISHFVSFRLSFDTLDQLSTDFNYL